MVEARNSDLRRPEIGRVGILKEECRMKELSMGLANLMEGTSMYSE
jgi:hypothetical protein